jgi:predicted MFS family arabinose efflux permease
MSDLADRPAAGLTPGLLWTLTITAGAAVANLYYNQPMLGLMAHSFAAGGEISLITLCAQLGYAAGLVLLVPLGDRMDRRTLILGQTALLALAMVLCALAPNLWLEATGALIAGIGATIAQHVVPFAADLARPEDRGRTVGTVMSGLLAGILVARTLSGAVGGAFGWRAMFWLAAVLALLLAALLAAVLPHSAPKTRLSYAALLASLGDLIRAHPLLRRATLIQACLFGGFSVFWSTLALLLERPPYHLGSAAAGLFGLVGLVGVGAASLAGRVADRRGPGPLVGVGAACVLAAFVVFGLLPSLAGLIGGVILLDLGVQMALVSNQARIYALGEATRSRINTVFITGLFLGGAAGSGLASLAWEQGGWPAVSGLGAALGLAALAVHLAGPRGG